MVRFSCSSSAVQAHGTVARRRSLRRPGRNFSSSARIATHGAKWINSASLSRAPRATRFGPKWRQLLCDGLIQGRRMGRYIDEILQPGERVLYSTNEHWMFFLPAIAAWIVAVVFFVLSRMVAADALMLVCLALAAGAWLPALYLTANDRFHPRVTPTRVNN